MRLPEPRVPPLPPEEWDDAVKDIMKPFVEANSDYNIFRTLARHPALMRRWLVFANHVLFKQTLALRERELAILRTGWLCRARYEWGQHVEVARRGGMGEADIRLAQSGPATPGIAAADRALLAATDELHADQFVSDATWQALSARFDERQCMDLVFTVGQYTLVSMALNTFGVQSDEGLPGWDV